MEETGQMLFGKNGPATKGFEKVKNSVASLYSQIVHQQGSLGRGQQAVVDEYEQVAHYFIRLYFFNICISLSMGMASTVPYLAPLVVFAASRELMIASSVASMA